MSIIAAVHIEIHDHVNFDRVYLPFVSPCEAAVSKAKTLKVASDCPSFLEYSIYSSLLPAMMKSQFLLRPGICRAL